MMFVRDECLCSEMPYTHVPGDGQCFYYSVLQTLMSAMTVKQFRKILVSNPLINDQKYSGDLKKNISNYRTWGGIDELKYISKVYNINVCVHCKIDNKYQYININQNNKTRRCIHLHFENQHYSPILINQHRDFEDMIKDVAKAFSYLDNDSRNLLIIQIHFFEK